MEELKTILEMVSGLGVEAKSAFIAFLLIKYALYYVTSCAMVVFIVKYIYKTVHTSLTSIDKNNRDMLIKIGVMFGYASDTWQCHREDIIDSIRDLKYSKKNV